MATVRVNHYTLDCDMCGFHTSRMFGDNLGTVDVEKAFRREHAAYAPGCLLAHMTPRPEHLVKLVKK